MQCAEGGVLCAVLYYLSQGFGNPTSVDFVWTNPQHMVASYQAAKVMTFDLETGQCLVNLDSGSTYGESAMAILMHINLTYCFPAFPLPAMFVV